MLPSIIIIIIIFQLDIFDFPSHAVQLYKYIYYIAPFVRWHDKESIFKLAF